MVFYIPFKIEIPSSFDSGSFVVAVRHALIRSIRYGTYSARDFVNGRLVQPKENDSIVKLIGQLNSEGFIGKKFLKQMQEVDAQHNSSLCIEVNRAIVEYLDSYIQQPKLACHYSFHFDFLDWLDTEQIFTLLNKKAFLTESSFFSFFLNNFSGWCTNSLLGTIDRLDLSQRTTLCSSISLDFLLLEMSSPRNVYNQRISYDLPVMDLQVKRLISTIVQFNPSIIDYVDEPSNLNLLMTIASKRPKSFKEIFEQLDEAAQARMLRFTSGIRTNLLTAAISSKNIELTRYVFEKYKNILGVDELTEMILATEQFCIIETALEYLPSAIQLLLPLLNVEQKSRIFTSPIYQGDNYLIKMAASVNPSLAGQYFMHATKSEQWLDSLTYCSPRDRNHALLVALSTYFVSYDNSVDSHFAASNGVKFILNLMAGMSDQEKTDYLSHANASKETVLTYLLMLSLNPNKPLGDLLDFFVHLIQPLSHEQHESLFVPLIREYSNKTIIQEFGPVMGEILTDLGITIPVVEPTPKRTRIESSVKNIHSFHRSDDTPPQPASSSSVSDEWVIEIPNDSEEAFNPWSIGEI